jgi:glycosyltransferase involved in cell wall biosynthesis
VNIACICSDFGIPIHGSKGASIHVREFTTALTRLGHRVEIFTPRAGWSEATSRSTSAAPAFVPQTVEILASTAERAWYRHLASDPAGGTSTAREFRSMLYNASLPRQAMALMAVPPDAVYERLSLFGTGGIELARALGVPHILEVNAPLALEQAEYRGSVFSQTAAQVEREIFAGTSHIVAVSAELRAWIIGQGVPPDKLTVTPNGVDLDRFAAGAARRGALREAYGFGNHPVIGFVGTLKGWHGTASLVRALPLLPDDAQVLIVGDGPQREMLEATARDLGVADRLRITGAVPHDDIPGWVAAMDVATAPYDASPNHYFSPLKLYEYMAAGSAIVAADIGQIAETIEDGRTGLLYEPGNDRQLAVRISALLGDRDLAAHLGAAARATAEAHHAWERNALAVTALIDRERRADTRSDAA